MHHLIRLGFNKSFFMGNQPCLFHVVNKHWPWWASNFKLYKVVIKLLLKRTIHQTSPGFHDIIPCIFLATRVLHFSFIFLSMRNQHNKLVGSSKIIFTVFINVRSLSVPITAGSASRLRKYLETVLDPKQHYLEVVPPYRKKQQKISSLSVSH